MCDFLASKEFSFQNLFIITEAGIKGMILKPMQTSLNNISFFSGGGGGLTKMAYHSALYQISELKIIMPI